MQINTLRILDPVDKASHNPEQGCLNGTRVEILAKLMQWIQGIETGISQEKHVYANMFEKRIIWLYGLAGSGKSTIANTIATILQSQDFHLARFFCKRDDASRSSAEGIFPTLSYQLTLLFPDYRDAILQLLNGPGHGDVLKGIIGSQVEELFTKTLSIAMEQPRPLVLVIDALDESGDAEAQAKVVTGLIAITEAIPYIKVFITSRNEDAIREAFDGNSSGIVHGINLNDVEYVHEDIRLYTEYNLHELKLDTNQADALAKKAGGLFVWSSTVFKFLKGRLNPRKELANLVKEAATAAEPLLQLYLLYDRILEAVPF